MIEKENNLPGEFKEGYNKSPCPNIQQIPNTFVLESKLDEVNENLRALIKSMNWLISVTERGGGRRY